MGIRKFLSYYKPYKGLLAVDLLCSVAVAALALALPICVRHITGNLAELGIADASGTAGAVGGDFTTEALCAGAVMLAIITAKTAAAVFYDYKGHDMGARIERDMRAELFAQYQRLPFGFFDGQQVGRLMSRLTDDLLEMAELCHHGPENLAVYGTQFIGSLVVLFTINRKLTLLTFAFLPVMALYSFIFYRRLETAYKTNRERIADVNARAEESLSGIRVVKSFAAEWYETGRFARENDRFYASRASIYKHEALHYSVIEHFFAPLITVAIVVGGVVWIARGELAPTDLLIFVMYAAYLTEPVPQLAFMVRQYQQGLAGYRRFREIMALMPEDGGSTDDAGEGTAREIAVGDAPEATREPPASEGRVSFRGVSFRYGEGREPVLKDINLDIAPGETVAFVGRSGIGKTTLCSLIPRFYDASEGDVLVDGMNVRDMNLQSLRGRIGVVRQETFLFAGTILENILYGSPGATADEAVDAAKKAAAHDFIARLPDGYDTDVGPRGARLSAGQRQRITIARVFVKNPPLLIFDEATSALDYESERAVIESLRVLSERRTTLIIAHRLSTIRGADRIVVLGEDGVIAEQGTHAGLYARGGEYAKLCDASLY